MAANGDIGTSPILSAGAGEINFLGSLDDSVSRYPWPGTDPTLEFLNSSLLYHALFGSPVAFRIGYLLHNDAYRVALTYPETSPLSQLVEFGFAKMMMTGTTVTDHIDSRVQKKTNSYLELVELPEWRDRTLPEALKAVDKLTARQQPLSWPENVHAGFPILMQKLAATGDAAFAKAYQAYLMTDRTRSSWEGVVSREFGAGSETASRLMQIANAAHHYNFVALWRAESPRRIRCETRQLAPLSDLTRPASPAGSPRVLSVSAVERLTKTLSPHIWIPKAVFAESGHWADLAHMAGEQHDTRRVETVHQAKIEFLEKVSAALAITNRTTERDAVEACKAYSDALLTYFNASRSERRNMRLRPFIRNPLSSLRKDIGEYGRDLIGGGAGAAAGMTVATAAAAPVAAGFVIGFLLGSVTVNFLSRAFSDEYANLESKRGLNDLDVVQTDTGQMDVLEVPLSAARAHAQAAGQD